MNDYKNARIVRKTQDEIHVECKRLSTIFQEWPDNPLEKMHEHTNQPIHRYENRGSRCNQLDRLIYEECLISNGSRDVLAPHLNGVEHTNHR